MPYIWLAQTGIYGGFKDSVSVLKLCTCICKNVEQHRPCWWWFLSKSSIAVTFLKVN